MTDDRISLHHYHQSVRLTMCDVEIIAVIDRSNVRLSVEKQSCSLLLFEVSIIRIIDDNHFLRSNKDFNDHRILSSVISIII